MSVINETIERSATLRTTLINRPEQREQQRPLGAWVAYAAICLLWGTTFLAIRVAVETMPTFAVTGIRFLGAGAILLVLSLAIKARFPKGRRDWINQMVNGTLMVAVGNSCVVFAEQSISSGLAALFAAMIPIWMAVLEAISGESRFTAKKLAGLALGFSGVALLVAPAIGRPDTSMKFFIAVVAMQVSSIAWNIGTLRSKRHRSAGDPTAVASIQMLSGGSVATALASFSGAFNGLAAFSQRSLFAVLYLMILGSVVAYSAYLYALSKISAGKLSSYAYVNPAIAVICGAIFLDETITLRMIVAMLVILAGVAVIQLDPKKKEA